MELVGILRLLVHHRLLVAVGALMAVAIGTKLAVNVSLSPLKLTSRDSTEIFATARVLVDTPNQPAVNLESDIADTAAPRAPLLADLLATDRVRAMIARSAGLTPDQLVVFGPSSKRLPLSIMLAVRATEASRIVREPAVLDLDANGQIAIISIKAIAGDPTRAVRIADAATANLKLLVAGRPPNAYALRIEQLGPTASTIKRSGHSVALGLAASIILFAMWCAAVVVLAGLARHVRASRLAAAA
jgi:hypothetical protein